MSSNVSSRKNRNETTSNDIGQFKKQQESGKIKEIKERGYPCDPLLLIILMNLLP
jgi:hypothetical protein